MSPPALTELPPRRVSLGGDIVEVRVRTSPVAQTIRLRVGPKHPLEVIVPAGTAVERIDDVLAQRAAWIARKLHASRAIAQRSHSLGLARRDAVWVDAEPIPLKLSPGARSEARQRDGALCVTGPRESVGAALARWYRREARRRVLRLVEQEAARLGVECASVAVRDQRTRWASCSRAGNLAFNWRLVMTPVDVQRYVVIHELCHLRIANHSKAFWSLLDDAMPGWRDHAAWLREHGHELRSYSIPT